MSFDWNRAWGVESQPHDFYEVVGLLTRSRIEPNTPAKPVYPEIEAEFTPEEKLAIAIVISAVDIARTARKFDDEIRPGVLEWLKHQTDYRYNFWTRDVLGLSDDSLRLLSKIGGSNE